MAIKDLLPIRKSRNGLARHDDPFFALQNEMNRIFENFMTPFRAGNDLPMTNPPVDIRETKKEIIVSAELPGMDAKEIDISLSNNVLTLQGEKREEKSEDKGGTFHTERIYGSFCRQIPLGRPVDESKVNAKFKRGVLTVKMPKAPEEETAAQVIDIQVL